MDILRDLVSKTNVYINSHGKTLNVELVRTVAQWVGKMLRMFGLGEGEKAELGWGQANGCDDNVNVCLFYIREMVNKFSPTQARRNFAALSEDVVVIQRQCP